MDTDHTQNLPSSIGEYLDSLQNPHDCKDGHPPIDLSTHDTHWKPVLDLMETSDKKNFKSLNDNVNNLLLFTGLFTAIVTAFAVSSYALLKPDPTDKSAQLLSQISTQLSSLTISGGFINSTANVTQPFVPAFTPSDVAITVNRLWYSSLTLSLFVAFFCLLMQQWIRTFSDVPQFSSALESIRLRQYRRKGWARWYASNFLAIISFLLQIAVVLFVIGLIHFLEDGSHTIAFTVTALAITWLVLFLVMTLMPIADPSCPYRSTIMTVWATWRLIIPQLIFFLRFASRWIYTALEYFPSSSRRSSYINRGMRALISCPEALDRFSKWLDPYHRERQKCIETKIVRELDVEALVWTSRILAGTDSDWDIMRCFDDLDEDTRRSCILRWLTMRGDTIHTLNGFDQVYVKRRTGLLNNVLSSLHNEGTPVAIPKTSIIPGLSTKNIDRTMSYILMFIWKTLQFPGPDADRARSALIPLLCGSSPDQEFDVSQISPWADWGSHLCIPSVLLFDTITKADVKLPALDPYRFIFWAQRALDSTGKHPARRFSINPQELILSSSAIALRVLVENPSGLSDGEKRAHLRRLLQSLSDFMQGEKYNIKKTLEVKKKKEQVATEEQAAPEEQTAPEKQTTARKLKLPFITASAINSICASLHRLAEGPGHLPLAADCPSSALAGHLREICSESAKTTHGYESIERFLEVVSGKPARSSSYGVDEKDAKVEVDSDAVDVGVLPADRPEGASREGKGTQWHGLWGSGSDNIGVEDDYDGEPMMTCSAATAPEASSTSPSSVQFSSSVQVEQVVTVTSFTRSVPNINAETGLDVVEEEHDVHE